MKSFPKSGKMSFCVCMVVQSHIIFCIYITILFRQTQIWHYDQSANYFSREGMSNSWVFFHGSASWGSRQAFSRILWSPFSGFFKKERLAVMQPIQTFTSSSKTDQGMFNFSDLNSLLKSKSLSWQENCSRKLLVHQHHQTDGFFSLINCQMCYCIEAREKKLGEITRSWMFGCP